MVNVRAGVAAKTAATGHVVDIVFVERDARNGRDSGTDPPQLFNPQGHPCVISDQMASAAL